MANSKKIRLSGLERLGIVSNLSTMLSSGISILESLDSLLEETKGNQKKVLERLRADMADGKSMSESFLEMPLAFDPVTVNLIKAAEESGTLETTLKNLSTSLKKDIEFTDKVKTAMVYPAFVTVVFGLVMLVVLVYVVPRIATVFERLRTVLPLPTKILIAVSVNLRSHWDLWLGGVALLTVFVLLVYKYKKSFLLNVLYSLPIVKKLSQIIDLTRFSRSMNLLLGSGIPVVEALGLAKKVVSKKEIFNIIEKAETDLSVGKKMSDSFRDNKKIVPALMYRVIASGEKSGSLEKSMGELADYFDGETANQLKVLTTLLEPLMLVVVGALVGGMMLSIIAPIYQLIGNIRLR